MVRTEERRCVFRGDRGSMDVKKFFFLFENVIAKSIELPSEKARELLLHLEGPAFEFFYNRFAEGDELSPETEDFSIVKGEFYREFEEKKEADVVIKEAIDLKLQDESLGSFLKEADSMYRDAGFNDEAKFGLLNKAVRGNEALRMFLAHRGPDDYRGLRCAVEEFEKSKKMYGLGPSEKLKSVTAGSKDPVEELTAQMSELVLQIKKLQKPTSKDIQYTCTYCRQEGHTSTRCEMNPDRDVKCHRCSKLGHKATNCWVKLDNEVKPSGEAEKSNAVIEIVEDEPQLTEKLKKDVAEPAIPVSVVEKRGRDGEPVQKAQRTYGVPRARQPVQPRVVADTPMTSPTTTKKKKSGRARVKKGKVWDLSRRVEKYDLLDEIAQAPTGLKFGQLVRGDALEAQKELKRLLVSRSSRKVATIDSSAIPRKLRLVEAQVESRPSLVLFDSGSVPNIMSLKMCGELGLSPKVTEKRITVANGETTPVTGVLDGVLMKFGGIVVRVDFLVVRDPPFGIIIGLPTMEALGAVVDTRHRMITLDYNGISSKLGMVLDIDVEAEDSGTDSEDFTSDEDVDSDEEGSDSADEELVLAVRSECELDSDNLSEKPEMAAKLLTENGLKVELSQCECAVKKKVHGHGVIGDGIEVDTTKTAVTQRQIIVETGASDVALGAVLSQKDEDGKVRPYQFASRILDPAERKYAVCEREALAVGFSPERVSEFPVEKTICCVFGPSGSEHGVQEDECPWKTCKVVGSLYGVRV